MIEITLKLSKETMRALASHAEREGVTCAVVAQRRLASLPTLSSSVAIKEGPLPYGMGGYVDAPNREE